MGIDLVGLPPISGGVIANDLASTLSRGLGPWLRKITTDILRRADHLDFLRHIVGQVRLGLILRVYLVDTSVITLIRLVVLYRARAHFRSTIYLLLLLDLSPTAILI
jgi:hypothetical protein